MNLGGPVWHVSIMPRRPIPERELIRMARKVLDGVGDRRLGEWIEHHRALHIRRRLTLAEQAWTGLVLDIRGTNEAQRRVAALGDLVQLIPEEVLAEELGL